MRNNCYAPAAVVLVSLGAVIVIANDGVVTIERPSFGAPSLTVFKPTEIWKTILLVCFAQIPLTATNAVLPASLLIEGYWPNCEVSERLLSLNMGIINTIMPLFGWMPLCYVVS